MIALHDVGGTGPQLGLADLVRDGSTGQDQLRFPTHLHRARRLEQEGRTVVAEVVGLEVDRGDRCRAH